MDTIKIDTTAEDVKVLREIAERKQKTEVIAGVFTLLLIGLIVGWWLWADNEVEAEKKWCRDASAQEFVNQYQTRCAQYSHDPAIRARIDRILSGAEK